MSPLARTRISFLAATIASFTLALLVTAPLGAQDARPDNARSDTANAAVTRLTPIVVTATRTETDAFLVPKPVAVVDAQALRERAAVNAADPFRGLPGLDVTGVGMTQVRPGIRGQRGQRILLLEDGMRLNNSRRQQSFGEIPGIVDVSSLERIEVVKGPASVLYGTDAVGGVVNLITQRPVEEGLHGRAGYRFGSEGDQHRANAALMGRFGAWSFRAAGAFRDGGDYMAPAGSFGRITLGSETRVFDTGTQDHSFDGYLGYDLSSRTHVYVKMERFRADTSGFGYVDPTDYAPQVPFIQILYPEQRFDKLTAGYRAADLGLPFADRVDLVGYVQDNERRLNNNVVVPIGPNAQVDARTFNYTDMRTMGFRAEAAKLLGSRVLLTYGMDLFRDRSENTDSSVTTVTGFGPPRVTTANTPLVPNATYLSTGGFLQGDIQLTERLSTILGGRYQYVRLATAETEGVTDALTRETHETAVGAANLLYRLTRDVTLVGAVGRAFRAPNLVESFFDGLTPEGAAYQVPNPALVPETSLNFDLGARYRGRHLSLEAFWFRNEIRNGIRIAATGDSLNGLPTFWNVNVDRLRFTGVELSADALLPLGFRVGGSYTHLRSRDALNANNPIGDSYADKLVLEAGYRDPGGRWWLGYDLRHNGDRKDSELSGPIGTSPIGTVLPAFTVHSVRGGATVLRHGATTHRLGLAVTNLTNALYAEFGNAGFFRPDARRGVTLSWDVSF